MCSCEGSLQPIVLNNRAASLGIAHCPDVSHTQRVTAIMSADVLQHKKHTENTETEVALQ